MQNSINRTLWILVASFAVMMSLPFLIPHCGFFALIGFVPLLCMDRVASLSGKVKLFPYHYCAFVLWNAFTTFWVCNATVGGGIFAILANSLQMSLIFGLFRESKKHFSGVLPYIFLASAWIAWERWYFNVAQISWPWLCLGNSFARSIRLVQWYEYTGTLGGSLWVWATNLGLFGLMTSLSEGSWFNRFNVKAKLASVSAVILAFIAPITISLILWNNYEDEGEPLDVVIAQPNIDPYQKFESLRQDQQDAILEDLLTKNCPVTDTAANMTLILAPETFTRGIVTGHYEESSTWRRFVGFLKDRPGMSMLFGASTFDVITSDVKPSLTARKFREGLYTESHNSSILIDGEGNTQIYHKSKLVVGTELTPYPRIFCPIDDMLGNVMGRDIGQKEISLLNLEGKDGTRQPLGCAVCYESVYGEYCTGYVKKGARALAVITNDAWWGNTPGYKQHCSYSSLRAIETRRDIARCGNTGISCFINGRGEIVERGPWWEKAVLKGKIRLRDGKTAFVEYGDVTGRASVFLFSALFLALGVRSFTGRKRKNHKGRQSR